MTRDIALHVGTYSKDGVKGLYPLSMRPQTDTLSLGAPDPSIENASFGAYSALHDLHYFVNEREDGLIGAYRRDGDVWQCLAQVSSGGAAPCHVSLDPEEGHLAVANYNSGSVSLFALSAGGLPQAPAMMHQDHGRGPDPERQAGPHAHCVRFHGGYLYHTDLGTDAVMAQSVAGVGAAFVAWRSPPGQGPRHLVFHPVLPVAYVLTELGHSLFVLDITLDGRLEVIQQASPLPEKFAGQSLGGHLDIAASGDHLYASNRGHDSLAIFAVDADGRVRPIQIAPTHGASPRFFYRLETQGRILVAHQNGHSVVALEMRADGTIGEAVARTSIPEPAYIGASFSRGQPVIYEGLMLSPRRLISF